MTVEVTMNTVRMRWPVILGLLAAAACTGSDTAATVETLLEADREFARNVATHGTEAWVSAFAADGMMFDGAQPVVGHDAIRAYMGPAFDGGEFSLTWDPVDARIASSGDLGYTRGR